MQTMSFRKAFLGRAPSLLQRPAPRRARAFDGTRITVSPRAAWQQLNDLFPEEPAEGKWSSLFSGPHIPPTNNPASVYDARDALEACAGLWGDERRECLCVFGLDADQVDTFYTAVFALEQALNMDTDPEEEACHQGQERV